MAKYNTPEEVDNDRRYYSMDKNHLCWGCPWAKVLQDRFVCPFVSGSCVKIPKTIANPDPELVSRKIWMSIHRVTIKK